MKKNLKILISVCMILLISLQIIDVEAAKPLKPNYYIPPSPVNLTSVQGNFWVNHTWQTGVGNKTDSYNISVNGIWLNGTKNSYYNHTVGPHGLSNISVWSYNSSGRGSLSTKSIYQSAKIINNPPIQVLVGNRTVNETGLLTFTVSAIDIDNDTITFGTNATKGIFNRTTGLFSWDIGLNDSNIYVWYFNSSDNYGGVGSEIITVNVTINQLTGLAYPSYNTEKDCRNCHGNDTSNTHHNLASTGSFNCTYCHKILYDTITQQYYPQVIRDCLACHPGENHDDCIKCHFIGSPLVKTTFVDIQAFNESIHQEINNTPQATLNNLDCWACHYYKDMNRQNVMKCGNCHRKPNMWHGGANITTNLSELW